MPKRVIEQYYNDGVTIDVVDGVYTIEMQGADKGELMKLRSLIDEILGEPAGVTTLPSTTPVQVVTPPPAPQMRKPMIFEEG